MLSSMNMIIYLLVALTKSLFTELTIALLIFELVTGLVSNLSNPV